MRRIFFILGVLVAASSASWAQTATPGAAASGLPATTGSGVGVINGTSSGITALPPSSPTPYGATPFGMSSVPPTTVPPSSVVSPGVGVPTNNLTLPATTANSAYDNSLPPTAQPNTLGGIETQGNPNPTVGGLPTTQTP